MRDSQESRKHFAEVAANWIKEGTGVTLIEWKRHTQNPYNGYTPYYTRAIRNARGEQADIDVRHFCDTLGAEHCYPDTGKNLCDVLKEAGYTCFDEGDAGLVVIHAKNPLLTQHSQG